MLSDVTVPIDTRPIVRAEIQDLAGRFGVVAWFGFHTRRWWALVEGRLVEAPPRQLSPARSRQFLALPFLRPRPLVLAESLDGHGR